MGVHRACGGSQNEIELTPIGVKFNASRRVMLTVELDDAAPGFDQLGQHFCGRHRGDLVTERAALQARVVGRIGRVMRGAFVSAHSDGVEMGVRVVSRTKSRKTPTRKTLWLFFV